MDTIRTNIVERLNSGHPDAKPFLDPEPPVEIKRLLRQSQAGGIFWRQQRDIALVTHAMSTRLEDLERALVHIQRASEDLEESPAWHRVLEAHTEMYQAARHPLGHALRMSGARFNDLGNKRNHLASRIANRTLSASSARRPSEKAVSAPAEPATSETAVRSFSKRSCGLTTSIPSSTATSSETEKGEETDSLLIKRAIKPVMDEHRGFFTNLFLVKKQDGGSDLSPT